MPTMRSLVLYLLFCAVALVGPSASARAAAGDEALSRLEAELRATEAAFAQTMADRDAGAFARFLSSEAVFFGREVTRGKEAVAAAWAPYFEGADAPFSWKPEAVAVLASGTLGLTSGPVLDPAGKRIGTFNSVWRREKDGSWRIVFDRGCPPCHCP